MRASLLAKHRWLVFVLPFVVFMLATSLEPKPPVPPQTAEPPTTPPPMSQPGTPPPATEPAVAKTWGYFPAIPYAYYPIVYSLKIALTVAAMLFVLPGYREFPCRVSPLAPAVGAIGAAVWIGLCLLDLERTLLPQVGLGWMVDLGQRSGYNPLEQLAANPAWAYGFLAIRFFGLVVVVAVIEEFFLRGFLMRYLASSAEWWQAPIGERHTFAIAFTTLFAVLMHPEMIAELVWFSLVTCLVLKTRNLWDAVVAHGVTNLLLGVYVVLTGRWYLM